MYKHVRNGPEHELPLIKIKYKDYAEIQVPNQGTCLLHSFSLLDLFLIYDAKCPRLQMTCTSGYERMRIGMGDNETGTRDEIICLSSQSGWCQGYN